MMEDDSRMLIDETGLWWKMTPGRSLMQTGSDQPGKFKKAKDCVTLLA